jgi:hypothetical protein
MGSHTRHEETPPHPALSDDDLIQPCPTTTFPEKHAMARKKAEQENGQERVNKMELVRQALATLGNDASPGDIAKHLKEQANLEMSTGMISNYKSSILKKLEQSPRRRGRKRGRPTAAEGAPATTASAEGVSIKDIRALREMSQRLGRSRLRELVELLH